MNKITAAFASKSRLMFSKKCRGEGYKLHEKKSVVRFLWLTDRWITQSGLLWLAVAMFPDAAYYYDLIGIYQATEKCIPDWLTHPLHWVKSAHSIKYSVDLFTVYIGLYLCYLESRIHFKSTLSILAQQICLMWLRYVKRLRTVHYITPKPQSAWEYQIRH